RVACYADSLGIHFLAADEIIERADAVPDGVAGDAVAGDQGLHAEHGVLARRGYEARGAQVGIVELQPFALADRVPGERYEALGREAAQHVLPRLMRLRAGFMPQRKQDGRER